MRSDIAITGFSFRFGDSATEEQLLANLCAGKDSIRPYSKERIRQTCVPATDVLLSSIEDIHLFDPIHFGISKGEADVMDPHQRLALEIVHEALEKAGYSFNETSSTGVYASATEQSYHRLVPESCDPMLLTGNLDPVLSGRIARFFKFTGPALAVDTACSSSLVALGLACNDLRLNNIERAVVCAVKLILFAPEVSPDEPLGIVSPSGKAKTFSSSSDGTGIGEAACAVVLRRLEDAERDHDPVFAVIKGYAMNQDSYRSSSLTSPSSVAQADVLTKAWEAAGISPEHISYLEAHGTGTKLGDPIEIDGISRAFAKYTQRKQFCAISAFKSNIGHTDAAAGLASLIKVIMALRYKKLFPTVHFDEPNNLIPFHESPVYVNSELRDWEPDSGRLVAGLSSFGISGTNCHFVIANAVERTNEAQRQSHTWLFPFSASSANALDLLLKQACDRLRVGSVNPGDLSYTLCCRRTHWEHRAAFVARDSVELVTAITEYRSSRPSVFKDFWFAFSDHIDQSWYSGAISVFKVFNDDISRCIESVGREEHFIGEAFQFSLFRFFEHINCPVSNVTGIGKGRLVANLVKNGKNFSDIVSYQMEDQSINRDRIIEFGKLLYETGTGAIDPSNDQALRRVLKNTTSEAQIIDVGSGDAIEFILRITQQMYLSGRNVKWGTLFSYNHSIVEWPTYPFEKIKCWIREPENPAGEWISTMGWAKADVKLKTLNAQSFIVVCDDEITGAKIVGPLEQRGHKCLLVSSDENRLRATRADLTSRKFVPTGIVYVAVGEGQTNLALSACDKNISRTVLPLFHIASVFSDLLTAIDFNLTAITTNARQVLPGDGVDAFASSIHGLLVAIACEYPNIITRGVDIDVAALDGFSDIIPTLETIIADKEVKIVTAIRDRQLYYQVISRYRGANNNIDVIADGKTYLISGGASGIGLELAKSISELCRCKIIILGRRSLKELKEPPPHLYQVGEHFSRTLFDIEQSGNTVDYYQCDVAKSVDLLQVVNAVRSKYGRVDCIIHSAGLGSKSRIQRSTNEQFLEPLMAKIQGTICLLELTKDLHPQTFVTFSSQSSIIGADRSSGYCAANMFLDNVGYAAIEPGMVMKNIRWGFWRETGMGKRYHRYDSILDNEKNTFSIAEGVEAFQYAMGIAANDIIISKVNPATITKSPHFITLSSNNSEHNFQIETSDPKEEVIDLLKGWTRTESVIRKIWSDILKVSKVSKTDNFFKLGGHSLLGVRTRNLIEKQLHIQLEFSDIIKFPVLSDLAVFIDGLDKNNSASTSIPNVVSMNDYELSHAQKRVWIACQMDRDQLAYLVRAQYSFDGVLDTSALQEALRTVVDRHEILRTHFVIRDGEPRQKIGKNDFAIESFAVNPDQFDAQVAELINDAQRIPFDLENGPLVRVLCFHTSAISVVSIMMHHIIADAWSTSVLFTEISTAYDEIIRGKESALLPLKIQYKDYAHWHNNISKRPQSTTSYKYWINRFDNNIPMLELPIDFDRGTEISYDGARFTIDVKPEVALALRQACIENGATLFSGLLATMNALLFDLTSSTDVVTGTLVNGRIHRDLENQVGFYLNTIPIRVSFTDKISFHDMIAISKKAADQAFEHQSYPFDQLIEDLKIKHIPSRHPLFDVMINMINYQPGERLQENAWQQYNLDEKCYSKFDLTLYVYEGREDMKLVFEYKSGLFTPSTIERIARRFHRILSKCSGNPGQSFTEALRSSKILLPEITANRV